MKDYVPIGELFPADDPIARWVFQLTAVAQDLSVADALFADARESSDPTATGYHYRQLLTRLYEAQRPVVTLEHDVELRAWVEALPDVAKPLEVLRVSYLPVHNSVVEHAYMAIRLRTVHHSWSNSDELKDLLDRAAHEQAWCELNWDDKTFRFEWPEAAMATVLSGDLTNDDELAMFVSAAILAQGILEAFKSLSLAALAIHSERVGIDPVRFTRQVGTPP